MKKNSLKDTKKTGLGSSKFIKLSCCPTTLKKWASVTVPTLVMVGGASPAFFHNGAQTLVDVLPNGTSRVLAGQDHGPADDVLASVLVEFFKG